MLFVTKPFPSPLHHKKSLWEAEQFSLAVLVEKGEMEEVGALRLGLESQSHICQVRNQA